MRNVLAALCALSLAGCVTAAGLPSGSIEAAPPPAAGTTCDATEAQQFIGRKASEGTGRSVLDMSGSRILRWGGPDTVFTMDYREERVNVIHDAGGVIERIYCG